APGRDAGSSLEVHPGSCPGLEPARVDVDRARLGGLELGGGSAEPQLYAEPEMAGMPEAIVEASARVEPGRAVLDHPRGDFSHGHGVVGIRLVVADGVHEIGLDREYADSGEERVVEMPGGPAECEIEMEGPLLVAVAPRQVTLDAARPIEIEGVGQARREVTPLVPVGGREGDEDAELPEDLHLRSDVGA